MADLSSLQSGTGWSHFNVLPDEILSEIQVVATHAHDEKAKRYRFPSTLCQVSRRWRGVAFNTPWIWSFIFIHDERTLEHTRERILRAGGVPLEIVIQDQHAKLEHEKVLEPLLPRCDRWVSLDLHVDRLENYTSQFPKSLPLVQSITFNDQGARFSVSTSLPRLKRIALRVTWLCWEPPVPFGDLTEFRAVGSGHRLRVPFKKVLNFLKNSPNLEALELNDSWIFEPETTNESVYSLRSQAADLPKLKAVKLDGLFSWEVVLLLSCVRANSLQDLMLSLEPGGLEEVPSLLHLEQFNFDFPSLRELTLKISTTRDETKHILLQMEHIQALSLIEPAGGIHTALELVMLEGALKVMTSRLSKIYIRGPTAAMLHKFLLAPHLTIEARSLLQRANWCIFLEETNGAFTDPERLAEWEGHLAALHLLIPRLNIGKQDQWWD